MSMYAEVPSYQPGLPDPGLLNIPQTWPRLRSAQNTSGSSEAALHNGKITDSEVR